MSSVIFSGDFLEVFGIAEEKSQFNSFVDANSYLLLSNSSIGGRKERIMTKVKMIGLAVLSLMIAAPAVATHQRQYQSDGRDLPVQDALHFGYGSGQCGYHSGYGGLYGDGFYPGNVCSDGGSHLID